MDYFLLIIHGFKSLEEYKNTDSLYKETEYIMGVRTFSL